MQNINNIETYFASMQCLKFLIDNTVLNLSNDNSKEIPVEKDVICLNNDKVETVNKETALVKYRPPLTTLLKRKCKLKIFFYAIFKTFFLIKI
jgi:hypothetical protein